MRWFIVKISYSETLSFPYIFNEFIFFNFKFPWIGNFKIWCRWATLLVWSVVSNYLFNK